MYELNFELKGLPRMTNANRLHWRSLAAHAKTWKRKVWSATWHLRPAEPLDHARLTLTRCSSREPDFDGLVSGFKHIIDGLVEAGIIVNDKPSNIGMPDIKWQKAKVGRGKLIVKVESVTKQQEEIK